MFIPSFRLCELLKDRGISIYEILVLYFTILLTRLQCLDVYRTSGSSWHHFINFSLMEESLHNLFLGDSVKKTASDEIEFLEVYMKVTTMQAVTPMIVRKVEIILLKTSGCNFRLSLVNMVLGMKPDNMDGRTLQC